MRVKCIKDFHDLERQVDVKTGDEFEVSETRGKALTSVNNKAGCVLCEEVTPSPEAVAAPKKSRKKKEG